MRVSVSKFLVIALVILLLIFLIAPTFVIMAVSFGNAPVIQFPPQEISLKWYEKVFTDRAWGDSIWVSLTVGMAATALACIAGTALAIAMSQGKTSKRVRSVVEILAVAPLAVPPIIIALGGYQMWSMAKLVGQPIALVPLYAVLGMPFVFLSTVSALDRLNPYLSLASYSLGGGKTYTIRRVYLPLIAPAIATGGFFAFVTMLDEIVIALFLLGTSTPSLPLKIFSSLNFGVAPDVAAVATLQVVVTVVLALAAIALGRRSARKAKQAPKIVGKESAR